MAQARRRRWGLRDLPSPDHHRGCVVRADEADAGRPRLLSLNSARAWGTLGWRPTWDVEEMLARTVAWYRAFYRGSNMHSLSLEQIAAYEAAVVSIDEQAVKQSA